jgi:hypothetical protein
MRLAPKEEPYPEGGPRPDPLAKRLGVKPDLMATSLQALAEHVLERTQAPGTWPDAQALALGWASNTKEIASLVLQKETQIHKYAIEYCEGDHDLANFELVQSQQFKRIDRRIADLQGQCERYRKQLQALQE